MSNITKLPAKQMNEKFLDLLRRMCTEDYKIEISISSHNHDVLPENLTIISFPDEDTFEVTTCTKKIFKVKSLPEFSVPVSTSYYLPKALIYTKEGCRALLPSFQIKDIMYSCEKTDEFYVA